MWLAICQRLEGVASWLCLCIAVPQIARRSSTDLAACVQGLHQPLPACGAGTCRPQYAGAWHSGATCHFRQPHGGQRLAVSGELTPILAVLGMALSMLHC